MLILVIGPGGVGKTTTLVPEVLSALHQAGLVARSVEAGGWVRRDVAHEPEHTLTARLVDHARAGLARDRDAALDWVRAGLGSVTVVAGVRSPFDFGSMFDWTTDVVIRVGGQGAGDFEREGLAVIDSMIRWASLQGFSPRVVPVAPRSSLTSSQVSQVVCWAAGSPGPRRCIVSLPEPVPVVIRGHVLGSTDDHVTGRLVALECYPGQMVTGMFYGCRSGGTFHDIPLCEFSATWDIGYLDDGLGDPYGQADRGSPVVESLPASLGRGCSIFGRDRVKHGEGESLAMLHWPAGNTLYHLVKAGDRLILWPPHKLLFPGGSETLPDWQKLKQ